MKLFFDTNNQFHGVLHYIYAKTKKQAPILTCDANKDGDDDIIALISSPDDANVFYSPPNSSVDSNIFIDLGEEYKIFPSHYQLRTVVSGTPPSIFSLSASNDEIHWSILDEPPENNNLCPQTDPTDPQCHERATVTFPIQNTVGPFRYIRFTVSQTRRLHTNNEPNAYIRLGGFEVYGRLEHSSFSLFEIKTCSTGNQFFTSTLLISLFNVYI